MALRILREAQSRTLEPAPVRGWSRLVTRNGAATRGRGHTRSPGRVKYAQCAAHQRAAVRALRPKVAKLDDPVIGAELTAFVEARMNLRWSPQQISAELERVFPDREVMRVSHETMAGSRGRCTTCPVRVHQEFG